MTHKCKAIYRQHVLCKAGYTWNNYINWLAVTCDKTILKLTQLLKTHWTCWSKLI